MKNNEGLNIELSSHTDAIGKATHNEDLSEKRAQEALRFLLSFGLDPNRIKAVGYGEQKPLNYCTDGVRCKSDEHAINRRTEFKIISN